MQLRNFLRAVIPSEGYKCWVEISKDKKVTQGLVPTIEELAAKILEIDARQSDAYFACASFTTNQNRRAYNALGAQAFWCDLDVGEGKPYATQDEAIDACDEFCNRLGLPLAGVVRSGGGVHVYWPLDRMLGRDEWSEVAKRFKLLTISLGFHADPSRTADIASILRPTGTKNYKIPGQPRDVEVEDEDLFEALPCDEFIQAIINFQDVPAPKVINNSLNSNLSSGLSKAFNPAVGVGKGSRGSTQLRYAGEMVAKGYPEQEVIARCLEWNNLCLPPQEEKEVLRIVRSAFTMHAQKHPSIVHVAPGDEMQLPTLPFGFKWGASKELIGEVLEPDDGGKKLSQWKVISHLPVYLSSWLNEEGEQRKNSYLFTHYHPVKKWEQFALSSKEFNSDNWYGSFVENGCSIVDGRDKLFKTFIRRMENMLRAPGQEIVRYSQFGWKDSDEAFLVGDNLCHADGRVTKAVGTDKLTPLMKIMTPSPGGSLEKWSREADKLFTPGVEAHGMMLLSGFAAPLMKFCVDEGNGGSLLSIISEDSGHGKTPMASAIASIWGRQAATVTTGNFTENRRIEDLVRHCHLPQVQEEMAYSDPQVAAQGIEKFTSGTDRGRLKQTGAASGIPERYQTILISISNKSLFQLVKMHSDPMSRRIFEIEISRPPEEILANIGGISREMMQNCGHAGLQFIRYVVNPEVRKFIVAQLSAHGDTVGETQLKYRNRLESRPEHRFIVWAVAAMDIAARILTSYKILHFDVERQMDWIVNEAINHIQGNISQDPINKLNAFLSENISSCLTMQGPYDPKLGPQVPIKLPSNNLFMRLETKTGRLYIANEPLQKWCLKKGISFVQLGKMLTNSKVLLERSRLITLGAGAGIPSTRTLCWEIDMTHRDIANETKIELVKNEALKLLNK